MKIIHILSVPHTINGVATVVSSISREQRNQGNDVSVFNLRKTASKIEGFTIVHDTITFCRELIGFKPDIVIFHSIYYKEYVWISKYLNKQKVPYLIQLHGALSTENYKKNHFKKWIANKFFFHNFIKKSSGIIYLNQTEYEDSLVRKLNSVKIVIPNGCDTFQTETIKSTNKNTGFKLLFLGRIDRYHKGLDVLLNTLEKHQFILNNNNIHIDFYGTGLDAEITWFKKRLEVLDTIASFYGPVYDKAKFEKYKDHDIFILTSRFEGMPMGVLEALSMGVPCLITKQTNMGEIIERWNCGWITELDVDSIYETILKAKSDIENNAALYKHNSLTAAQNFTWQNIAKISIDKYSEIIRNS